MKTVGQLLNQARLEKKISLEQAAQATKIRPEFLLALEKDDYSLFSDSTSVSGLVKNYALFLGLKSASVLAVFRRDFSPGKKKEIILQGMVKPVNQKVYHWCPKLTLIGLTLFFFLLLVAYLGYQYFSLVKPPYLEIITPESGQETSLETIEVKGKANPEAMVKINDQPVLVSGTGEFIYSVQLFPGENKIIIKAENSQGKETQFQRSVFRLDK